MKRIKPKSGQESVWDYPRPPRLEDCHHELRIMFAGQKIAESTRGKRVLETSHPPVYYIPADDVRADALVPTDRVTFCEWKGVARYYHVMADGFSAENAAWFYERPTSAFREIQDHLAFYAHLMDACYVDGERVQPQPGAFYGGWITENIVGPFKGAPGTHGW